MKTLSIRQPWSHAILHLGKRLENRDWAGCAYRGPVLLHAGQSVGTRRDFSDAAEAILDLLAEQDMLDPSDTEREERFREDCLGIKAVGAEALFLPGAPLLRGGIVGRARIVGTINPKTAEAFFREHPEQRAWWSAGFALVLADVETLPFVPWKGARGLFDVQEDYAAIAAARGAA